MRDEHGAYLANITMDGQQSEHEEESGRLKLYDHPFNKDLTISEIWEQPFREMWMREGVQTFEPLDPAPDGLGARAIDAPAGRGRRGD